MLFATKEYMPSYEEFLDEFKRDWFADYGCMPTQNDISYFKVKYDILSGVVTGDATHYDCYQCEKTCCGVKDGIVETVDGEYVCQSCYERSLGI